MVPPPRPPAAASSSGDDDPQRVTRMFADQAASATAAQKTSVERWQSKDERFYRQVQEAISGRQVMSEDAIAVANDLDALASPLADDVVVWRGLRNASPSFGGVAREHLETIIDQPLEQQRFTATSLSRDVAEQEFTRPGQYPVLLKITARAGTSAVWMPPLGTPENAYQLELLFPAGTVLRILSVDRTYSVPVVEVEVSDGG